MDHFNAVADNHLLKLLNGSDGPIDMPLTKEDFIFATLCLGASADKTGDITVDMVFYTNSIMGLNKKNASGYYDQDTVVDFTKFDVDRHPRYEKEVYVLVPEMEDGKWVDKHWVEEWVELKNDIWTLTHNTYNGSNPDVFTGDVAHYWETDPWEYKRYNIEGFVQASDDNLKVLAYIHDHFVPPAPDIS